MKQEDIDKMFEGRWRMKNYILENIDGKAAKEIAKDFFEAGIALSEPQSDVTPDGFEEFWALYDKRVGKAKCEKLWAKLTQKEKQDCMAYIPLYKQAQSDKQYRKNPETFLRNKSFYDEIIIRHNPDQQRQQRLAAAAERIAEYTKDGK